MKVKFITLGCKLNFAESSALGKVLLSRGHTRAKAGEEADVCIINTCTVTDTADHKDRQAIHRIRRQNPNAILIVTGCYAQLQPHAIAAMPEVDYVLGQNEKFGIPELVERLKAKGERLEARVWCGAIREVEEFHGAYSRDDRTRCFLKVQDGCNYFCTYCTIPHARGKSRNPHIAELVQQATQALQEGAKEIVLTGVNIGDFGRSTGETFIDLLRALDGLTPYPSPGGEGSPYRIRISSCEPNLLTDEIIDFVAHSAHFAPHFHIPLQSGSNEVLQIMHRRYTRELFQERVEHIKRVMPNAFIGVDCMVGVRGETKEYFDDYVQFIQSLPVSQLHVFTYSERANTHILDMDLCVVPMAERHRRSEILHSISEQKLHDFYASYKDKEAIVLWEGKKDGNKMSGFTENYIRVETMWKKEKINTFEKIIV